MALANVKILFLILNLMPCKMKIFKQDKARENFDYAAYGLYVRNQNF